MSCVLNKVDVFFDNVGGDILEAALNHINLKARVVLCGGIANYNATEPQPGPSNLMNLGGHACPHGKASS